MADGLPVAAPRLVGRLEEGLLLTELPGLRPFDFRAGPEPGHAALAMEGLAALHAAGWGRARELAWLPSLADPELRRAWQADFDAGWTRHRARLDAICPPFTAIGDALVGRLSEALAPLAAPQTLLHGDAHGENLPLSSEGSVAFLDWQAPRLGSPAFDVAAFATMSYPVRRRRDVEEALHERHLRALRDRGVAWEGSWTAYRRGVLRRAARIVEICARGRLPSLDWVFGRCATAAVDHRVLDLLA